jgi:hypothetical protein
MEQAVELRAKLISSLMYHRAKDDLGAIAQKQGAFLHGANKKRGRCKLQAASLKHECENLGCN